MLTDWHVEEYSCGFQKQGQIHQTHHTQGHCLSHLGYVLCGPSWHNNRQATVRKRQGSHKPTYENFAWCVHV